MSSIKYAPQYLKNQMMYIAFKPRIIGVVLMLAAVTGCSFSTGGFLAKQGDSLLTSNVDMQGGHNSDGGSSTTTKCGNNIIEEKEECDGSQLMGQTCQGLGFDNGILQCAIDCKFNSDNCHYLTCGDGQISGAEQCESLNLNGQTCQSLGFETGTLSCKENCMFNTNLCQKCGDGILSGTEECEGSNLAAHTCQSFGQTGGTLVCDNKCKFDLSNCYSCGDGKISSAEQCDGALLNNKTCQNLGQGSGTLSCGPTCQFDISKCSSADYQQIGSFTFTMGSDVLEDCRYGNEDLHWVTLTKRFEMQTTEVTQQQFMAVMNYNPSTFQSCSDCPVESVTWYEAANYCNTLSKQHGLAACYDCNGTGTGVVCNLAAAYKGQNYLSCPGYRLPTEAEWEGVYRASTTWPFYNGYITNCTGADNNADKIAWYLSNTTDARPHSVAKKQPNNWLFYDMAGNVAEWTADWEIYNLGILVTTDPVGPDAGTNRIVRGGAYSFEPRLLRAATRMGKPPTTREKYLGFRCAHSINQ